MNADKKLSPVLALVAAVAVLAAVVEYMAPAAGATRIVREANAVSTTAIRVGGKSYPRTAQDSDDSVVQVARPVRSVVSQYWAIDEFLYAVVPPANVTGVSQSAYLEKFSNVFSHVQKYRPAVATDPERVIRINADLILVSSNARADYTAVVRSTGVPIHRMFTAFTTLGQVAEAIRLVGYLTGEDASAEAEYKRFSDAVNRAKRRRPPDMTHPRVLGLGGLNTYGSGTLFHDVIQTLGGVNVGAEGGLRGYATVSTEQVLRWDPEWIVVGAEGDKTKEQLAKLMADPAISITQAARNGRIVVIDYRVFLPMSPYTRIFLDVLGDTLYGR